MVYFEPVTCFSFEFHIELSKSPRGSDWIIPGKQLDSDYYFSLGERQSCLSPIGSFRFKDKIVVKHLENFGASPVDDKGMISRCDGIIWGL